MRFPYLGAYLSFLLLLLLLKQGGQCQEDEEPWDQYVSDAEDSGTMETKLGFGSALLIIGAYKVSEQFDQQFQRILRSMGPLDEFTTVIQQAAALTKPYKEVAAKLELESTREEGRKQFEGLYTEAEAVRKRLDKVLNHVLSDTYLNAGHGAAELYPGFERIMSGFTGQTKDQLVAIRFTLRLLTKETSEWKGAKVLTEGDRTAVEGLLNLMENTGQEADLVTKAATGQLFQGNHDNDLSNLADVDGGTLIKEYMTRHALQLRRVMTSTIVRRVLWLEEQSKLTIFKKQRLGVMIMYESGMRSIEAQLNNESTDFAIAKSDVRAIYEKYYNGDWMPKRPPPWECLTFHKFTQKGIGFSDNVNKVIICD